jgi:hypothetical protein
MALTAAIRMQRTAPSCGLAEGNWVASAHYNAHTLFTWISGSSDANAYGRQTEVRLHQRPGECMPDMLGAQI